jgi:hypothetical protein
MNPRYLYLIDDPILLNENVLNNGKFKTDLYQIHAGVKIVNRDNIPRRSNSKIRSEYRDINSKIILIFSDLQMMENIIKNNRNENNDNNRDKKNSPLIRRSTPIISLVPCEKERINIGKIN